MPYRALSGLSEYHGHNVADFISELVANRHLHAASHPRAYLAKQLVWAVGDLIERQTSKKGLTRSSSGLTRHPSAPNDAMQPTL